MSVQILCTPHLGGGAQNKDEQGVWSGWTGLLLPLAS